MNSYPLLNRSEMKNIIAGNSDPDENTGEDCGFCADWAICCICLDGTNHGCQTSEDCDMYCSF